MKILVCGGRDFDERDRMHKVLLDYIGKKRHIAIIHGGARGADLMAKQFAIKYGIAEIQVDANWRYYDYKAGPIRNAWMLQYCEPNIVIAFPGGTGTENMIKLAIECNIEVLRG